MDRKSSVDRLIILTGMSRNTKHQGSNGDEVPIPVMGEFPAD
jgi:hypothetical protein